LSLDTKDRILVLARYPTLTWWHSEEIVIELWGIHLLWEIEIDLDEKVTISFSALDAVGTEYQDIELPIMG